MVAVISVKFRGGEYMYVHDVICAYGRNPLSVYVYVCVCACVYARAPRALS